jgi:integrase
VTHRDGWYNEGGKWRKRYKNEDGKRAEFIGYADKTLSKKGFERRLDEVAEIKFRRLTGKAVNDTRDVSKIAQEYLAWGAREGGKGGRPWADGHRKNVVRDLSKLVPAIGARRLDGITLAAFERALVPWENPRTRFLVGSNLKAFLSWCKTRKMLAENPLEDWPGRKMESDRKRRPLTLEEFEALCAAAPPARAIAYEFALYTGARASEFNHLKVESCKWDRGGVYIASQNTKARKEHFFPLPADYLARLQEWARYRLPGALLFDLSKLHKDRYFDKDRAKAGIEYETDEGFVGMHSIRHLFETLLGAAAPDLATVLGLGRHTDLKTNRIYQHTSTERKRLTVEGIAGLRKDSRNKSTKSQAGSN